MRTDYSWRVIATAAEAQMFNPPFLFQLVFLDVTFWFLTIPAAAVLVIVGWYAPYGLRWVAFGAAVLLAVPVPVVGGFVMIDRIETAHKLAALERSLDRDESVAGVALPAGSKVYFADASHARISWVELPGAASIRGVRVVGNIDWVDGSRLWHGMLAEDQRLDGWPCHAGLVEFDDNGLVQECEFAAGHEVLGFTLPPGTTVTRGDATKPWKLRLPGNAGAVVPVLSTTAPPGVTLFVKSNGELDRLNSGDGQTIMVRGVPLSSMNLYLRDTGTVVAALAVPFMVAGEMQPAGTGVRTDLITGEVSLAGKNWWLRD
jgi:hypothetical protein